MKKKFLFLAAVLSFSAFTLIAQPPPPPPDNPGTTGGPVGPVGGPIDGGLGILLVLAGIYGTKKVFDLRKSKQEENIMDD